MQLDPSLSSIIDAHLLVQKAHRALYISTVYSKLERMDESLVLVKRAEEHAKEAQTAVAPVRVLPVDTEHAQIQKDLTDLESRIQIEKIKTVALISKQNLVKMAGVSKDLGQLSVKESLRQQVPLLSRLDQFATVTESTLLIDFPPRPLPAPLKPLLFDLAFESVSEYDLTRLEPKVQGGSSGIMGVLSGLWGRS